MAVSLYVLDNERGAIQPGTSVVLSQLGDYFKPRYLLEVLVKVAIVSIL